MRIFFYLPILFLSFACSSGKQEIKKPEEIRDQAGYEKIDFHAHYRYNRTCLEPLLNEWNMKSVLVDVAAMDSLENEKKWLALKNQHNSNPDRYYLCTSFAALEIDDPDFAQKIIRKLDKDIADGAVMVKVWKVHGMEIRDQTGNFIQIDDQRMQPIWDFLATKKIPVLAHIGEPRAAWLPLDDKSPHFNYYKSHPQYHAYLHPEIPSWETIMEARDRWIANNPDLTIIAAHLGSMAYDVDLVAQRLDIYPNMYVETAARFGDLTLQDSETVRKFFVKYQDRVLYGTDLGFSNPENEEDPGACDFAGAVISRHWKYFTEKDSMDFDSPMVPFKIRTKGLNLPDSVLRKVYKNNAFSILGIPD